MASAISPARSKAARVNGPTLSGGRRTLRAVDSDIPLKELFRLRAWDLLAILQMLSEGRYTARQLARVIPEGVVLGSTCWSDS